MRKLLILISLVTAGLILLSYNYTSYAQVSSALNAPHNATMNITCNDCHTQPGFSGDQHCLRCHIAQDGPYSKNQAPKVLTHSSATVTPEGETSKYGEWSRQCKDCHWTEGGALDVGGSLKHGQVQYELWGPSAELARGTITAISDNGVDSTTFTYSGLSVKKAGWGDVTKWGRKTGNDRGIIIYPNINQKGISFEVKSATSNSITVKGSWSAAFPSTPRTTGTTFSVIYGQYVRVYLRGANGQTAWTSFFDSTGADSFANNDYPQGICQVCHTQTKYWRADGTLKEHNYGTNCMTCHSHKEGFKAAGCDTCHGFPPVNTTSGGPNGLVNLPAPTGSTTAGSHSRHNALGMDCTECHYNSKGSGPTHNDNTVQAITLGFSLFGNTLQGGSYDGQTGVDYNTTVTSPVTTVSNTGTRQCSNLYCHSAGQGAGGGALAASDYKTPMWGGTAPCGSCHLSDGAQGNQSLMISGSHGPHANAFIKLGCSECHNGAGPGTATHVNRNIELAFKADPFSATGSYSQIQNPPGNGYGSCSNIYCHSVVQRQNGAALLAGSSDYKTPTWGVPGTAQCGSCHANGNMSTGSHTKHIAAAVGCSDCHYNAGALTAKHADYNIDVMFKPDYGASAAYSQSPNTPGNGYGSCSSLNCHSDGKATPTYATVTWGATGAGLCVACHGGAGGTLGGANTALTSAHTLHTGSGTGQFSYTCNACHSTVAGSNTTIINNELHNNSIRNVSITAGFGGNGSNYSGSSCSTTYCHGSQSVTWTSTAGTTGNCSLCHGMSNSATDGRDTNGDTAATDPQVGAHVVHLNGSSNYSSPIACSECHTVPAGASYAERVKAAGHIDTALPAEVPMNGTLARTKGAIPAYASGTCSNLYCHGSAMDSNQGSGISPVWSNTAYLTGTPSLAGDCSQCHKSPPVTAPHSPTMTLAECAQCHSHFNANGTLNNKTLHIDGNVQAAGGCNACHGYPPAIGDGFPYRGVEGKGAHVKHINDIAMAKGVTLNPENDTYGSGAAGIVCGTCHSNLTSDHMSGTRVINFSGSNEYMFGLNAPKYNGVPGTSSTVNLKSCSNISCHYGTTPGWQNPATAGQ